MIKDYNFKSGTIYYLPLHSSNYFVFSHSLHYESSMEYFYIFKGLDSNFKYSRIYVFSSTSEENLLTKFIEAPTTIQVLYATN